MDRKWFAIIALFVVVLGVATYFSIDKLFPKTTKTVASPSPAPGSEFTYTPGVAGEVSVLVSTESQNADAQTVPVFLTNSTYIKGKLNEWNFWKDKGVVGFNASGKKLDAGTAKALDITVIEQSTSQYPFKVGDSGFFRVELDYATGAMAFYIYLGEGAFETQDSATLAKRISDIALTAAYLVTHPDEGLKPQTSQTFVGVSK